MWSNRPNSVGCGHRTACGRKSRISFTTAWYFHQPDDEGALGEVEQAPARHAQDPCGRLELLALAALNLLHVRTALSSRVAEKSRRRGVTTPVVRLTSVPRRPVRCASRPSHRVARRDPAGAPRTDHDARTRVSRRPMDGPSPHDSGRGSSRAARAAAAIRPAPMAVTDDRSGPSYRRPGSVGGTQRDRGPGSSCVTHPAAVAVRPERSSPGTGDRYSGGTGCRCLHHARSCMYFIDRLLPVSGTSRARPGASSVLASRGPPEGGAEMKHRTSLDGSITCTARPRLGAVIVTAVRPGRFADVVGSAHRRNRRRNTARSRSSPARARAVIHLTPPRRRGRAFGTA